MCIGRVRLAHARVHVRRFEQCVLHECEQMREQREPQTGAKQVGAAAARKLSCGGGGGGCRVQEIAHASRWDVMDKYSIKGANEHQRAEHKWNQMETDCIDCKCTESPHKRKKKKHMNCPNTV